MTSKPVKLILNPYAGRWKAKRKINPLKRVLDQLGVRYELTITETPGDGIDVARQAAESGYTKVVAVGGDSTVSEVVNGLLLAAGDDKAGDLGIIPLGTANDLADVLNIPRDLKAACQKVVAGQTRVIDVGCVNGRFFDNNSAVGLESLVTANAEKIKVVGGPLRYILAALKAIGQNPVWQAKLAWDHGSYQGPITLISVGNSPRTGGSFWMTPNAQLDDGKLDVVFALPLKRLELLSLLPQTFWGRHIDHKAVISLQVTSLSIAIEPTLLQVDGELVDRQTTQIDYHILPKKLRVII